MSMMTTTRETSEVLEDIPPDTNGAGPSEIHVNVENGNHHDSDELIAADGEVSPSSLRRSTRASALKAQEKIKFKEGMGMFPMPNGIEEDHPPDEEKPEIDDDIKEPVTKKRKLMDGLELDQYDCKFGVRMDNDDVYMLTDESEISSLNSEEVGDLKKSYEEFKQAGITTEQQFERDLQVKELEAQLRMEENKLVLLKKTVSNQKEAEVEVLKKQKLLADAVARQQQHMNAYKPSVATNPTKINGTTPKSSKGKQNNTARDTNQALLGLDPQIQRALIQRLMSNPQLSSQASQLLNPQLLQALQQQQQQNVQKPTVPVAPPPPPQPAPKKEPAVPTTTPAQRAAEARRKLRQQLDQQLLSIPQPKPLVSDINFIPSSTSDFLYLLGLDLTVQRVLKDKNVFKKYDEVPYTCEECGTDFTPAWKAIVGTENDLHLYCEKCVKDAQKKKMKQDHTLLFKKAFAKISEQEKELEKQIAGGKFDDPPPPPPPPPPPKAATPSAPKQAASTSSLHQSISAGNLNQTMAAALLLHQQQQKQKSQQQTSQASTSTQSTKTQSQSKSSKRSQGASSNATASTSNQNQILMNMVRAANPMLAAMMGGGNNSNLMQLQQLWALANGGGNNASNNRSGTNNTGALALLQAAMQANSSSNNTNQQQQQNFLQNMMSQSMLAQLAMMQNQNSPTLLQNIQRLQQQTMSKSKK